MYVSVYVSVCVYVLVCMCVCVCVQVCSREKERSIRQLYLHLYEQIPVGRAAEEHTSCLIYIAYQAVLMCTVP